MVKIGLYLPVYGGWFPEKKSAKAETDGIYFEGEKEEPPTYEYVKRTAIEAEKIGIDSLWIPDHMLNPIKGERAPSLEAWTVAVGIAEATKKVIIAHTTLCEAFRYPAVLAKQVATLSEISKGRFWLSLGACWFRREFLAYGLPFYPHDDRVDRAREAMQIIKKLWSENNVTYRGKYYSVENCILEPKPDPKPPIWYAGMSEASRNLVAEEADGWLMRGCSLDEAKEFIEDMESRLNYLGRDSIDYAIPGLAFIRETDEQAMEYLKDISGMNRNVLDRTLDTGLIGSPETVAEKIEKLNEIGIDHVLLQLTPTLKELRNVERLLEALK
jgi:FMNH2-dependent dimethyl sulfone monooxygenase